MNEKSTISRAYLGVCVEPGSEKKALTEIRKLGCVEEAHELYGVYDIFAKVRAENIDKLREKMNDMKKEVPYINSHITMLILEEK